MSIIYALVANGEIILAEHTTHLGNFSLIANQILKKTSNNFQQLAVKKVHANNYVYYIFKSEYIFMVMCDESFKQRLAFKFLEDLKRKFVDNYPKQKIIKSKMYELMDFSKDISMKINMYNTELDKIDNVTKLSKIAQQQCKIVEQNLQKTLQRGSDLQVLVQKSQASANISLQLKNNSKAVWRKMCCENMKMKLLLALVIAVVIYLILVSGCGGFSLPKCF